MKQAYAHAIESGYRFYSYGDACLSFRNRETYGGQRRTCAVPTIYRHRDCRRWARSLCSPCGTNLVALILRSARLARFVAFPTFGGLSGAFVHAVTFALVIIVPRTSDRADQDQPEDISPISLRHRQPPNISVSSELNERFAVKPAGGTRPSSISGISFPVKQRGAHHLTPSRAAAAIPRSGRR
jgi:hypothetical protein